MVRHPTPVRIVRPGEPAWASLLEHLGRAGMVRVVERSDDPALRVLVVREGDRTIGHLALCLQPIAVREPSDPRVLEAPDGTGAVLAPSGRPLLELYVQSFAVDEDARRRGVGSRLQRAALRLTAQLGAVQMRSWSSSDRTANYALKVRLGFGVHPSIQQTRIGPVAGAYFVRSVRPAPAARPPA